MTSSYRFLLSGVCRRVVVAAVMVVVGALFCGAAVAQTVRYVGVQTTLLTNTTVGGSAVDHSGNVYFTKPANDQILVETPGTSGYSYTQTTIANASVHNPQAIAVDAAGNLYVVVGNGSEILKLTLAGGTYTASTVVTGLGALTGVAVTPDGTRIYAVSPQQHALYQFAYNGVYVEQTTSNSGLIQPRAITLDASGNFYILDSGTVYQHAPGFAAAAFDGTQIVSGLNVNAGGLAVDGTGDLFIADSANNRILEEVYASSAYTQLVAASGFTQASGVAVNAGGTLYITSTHTETAQSTAAPNFGSVAVGTASAPLTLAFVFDTGGALDGTAPVQFLTQGVENLEFSDAGSGTCISNHNYAAGATCAVAVTFTPTRPGGRNGAVLLSNTDGAPIGTAFVHGIGLGPQIAFTPTQISLQLATRDNGALAVDPAGNIFFGDTICNCILEEKYSNGNYSLSSTKIGSGLTVPFALAIDGAGNLYVEGLEQVFKETLANGVYTQDPNTIPVEYIEGLAVDGAGTLYIVASNTRLYVETFADGAYAEQIVQLGTDVVEPSGVAVDAAGEIYVADAYGKVVRGTIGNGVFIEDATVATGLVAPNSIAVDNAGDVYINDIEARHVVKVTYSNGSYSQDPGTVGSGFSFPEFVATDGAGNVYVADPGTETLYVESVTTAPTIAFPDTPAGDASLPMSTQVTNLGNEPLVFSVPGSGENPATGANFALESNSDTTCPIVLSTGAARSVAAAATCTLSYVFTPEAPGLLSATSVLTDDSLNATAAVQTITLTGTASQDTQNISFTLPAMVDYYSGETVALNGTATSGLAVTYTLTGPATIAGSVLTITGTGTVSVTASQPGDTNVEAATPVMQTVNVSPAVQVASSSFPDTAIGSSSASVTVSVLLLGTGAPINVAVLTQGTAGLDFQSATGGTCSSGNALVQGSTCTVNVVFGPRFAGLRYGAVVLTDANSNVIGTTYLEGKGLGPQIAFAPTQISLPLSNLDPGSVAVDAAGDIFFGDFTCDCIREEAYSNGNYNLNSVMIGIDLAQPRGLAIDGAGNVFIVDTSDGYVFKEAFAGGTYTQNSNPFNITGPTGIAIDGAGNLYITAEEDALLYVETLSGGIYTEQIVQLGQYVSAPAGVALDGAGEIYIVDNSGNVAVKGTLANGVFTEDAIIGDGLRAPFGIAVDSASNVYITDSDNSRVVKLTYSISGLYQNASVIGNGFSYPQGIATDGAGNVYVADPGGGHLYLESVTNAPTIAFPDTPTGDASTPVATTITNLGNEPLFFSVPTSGENPNTGANFALESNTLTTCPIIMSNSAASSLAANASCKLSYIFTPAALGQLSANSVLTDDTLNATGAVQTITLTGTATQGTQTAQTIYFPIPSQTIYPGNATLNATATSGLPVTYTVVSGPATVSGSTLTYTGDGAVMVEASQAGNVTYSAAPSQSVTLQVSLAQSYITWYPTEISIYTGTTLGEAGALDATDSVPATIAYSAKLQSGGISQPVTSATVLSEGAYGLAALITPQDTTNYAITTESLPFLVQNMNVFAPNVQGSMLSFYNNGTQQSTAMTGGGTGAAVDHSGYVWSIDSSGGGVSKFNDSGVFKADYSNEAGIHGATALAIDGNGWVWIANSNSVSALNNDGTPAAGGTMASAFNISSPASISVDTAGSLWIANSGNNTITEIIGAAAPVTAPTVDAVINKSMGTRP